VLKYIITRLFAMVITLFVIVTLAFMVIRLMPGTIYEDPDMPAAVLEALEARLHLNKPLYVQYGYFLKGIVLEGDWGTSIKIEPRVPAFHVLRNKIPISLTMNILSLAISLPIGIIAGTIAALTKNKLPDYVISFLVVICISVPSFVFASMLQYFLAFKLSLAPIIYKPTAKGLEMLHSLALPILALSLGPIATVTRYLRGELIETLSSEFMLLARTKGLTRFQATLRHAFRNSCVPLANIIIPMFTSVLGGSLVIERIFAIPGVGGIMINSINASDHPLTIAVLIFYSVLSLLTILIVDISYGIIDPRIRMGASK
jgi:oligopeptide transport system permease protein